MDDRIWNLNFDVFSDEFLLFFRYSLLALIVIFVVFATVAAMSAGSGWRNIEEAWDPLKPLLVAAAFVSLPDSVGNSLSGSELFGLSFVFGLFCGVSAISFFLTIRDVVLSVAAVVLTVLTLSQIVFAQGVRRDVFYMFIALAVVGFVLTGAGMLSRGSIGVAVLGGVEVLIFLLSPFGIDYVVPSAPQVTIGAVAALLLGVGASLRPVFTIALGVGATAMLGIAFQVFLAFERSNFPNSPLAPNWSYALAFGGTALGYVVLRLPYMIGRSTRV